MSKIGGCTKICPVGWLAVVGKREGDSTGKLVGLEDGLSACVGSKVVFRPLSGEPFVVTSGVAVRKGEPS